MKKRHTVTLCICTKDRPASFVRLMQSLVQNNLSHTHLPDILVIDASTIGGTKKAVEGFCARYPSMHISYRHVDVLSTSYSRNIGAAECNTTYICYLDDDVTVNSNWLAALMSVVQKTQETDVFFGAILPVFGVVGWKRVMVDFILTHAPWVFAANATGTDVIQPYSANVVIRRAVFTRVGMFNAVLGVSDSHHFHPRGEDAEWFMRAGRKDIKPLYVSGMDVAHHITNERVTPHAVFLRFIEDGRNRVLFAYYEKKTWSYQMNLLIVRVLIGEVKDIYRCIIRNPASLSKDSPRLQTLLVWVYMSALFFAGEAIGGIGMNVRLQLDRRYYSRG